MRFRRLDLIAFGQFTDVSLELQRPADLHLVLGPNEAGKTMALRAIDELLYGMPVHTDLAFRHPMNRLRLGAVIEGTAGETLEVVRRKGRLDTLRTPDDEPVPESRLGALLGGVGRQLFQAMFGFHHDGLVAGGEELLRGEGEVGRSLYGAAVGAGRVHTLLAELDRQAEEIYRPRGSRLLNQAMADHDAARRRVRELQLRPRQWQELSRAVDDAASARERLEARLLTLDADLRRLRRLQAALPLLARRRRLEARAAEIGDVPDVPPPVARRHREVTESLRAGAERHRETVDRLAEIEAALAAVTVDDALLAGAAEIQRLAHGRGRYEKDARDRDALGGRLAETISQAGSLLRQVWPEMQVEVADRELRLTTAERDCLEEGIASYPVLRERLAQAERAAARLGREAARRRARLAALGDPPDPAPLLRALERSRRDGRLSSSREEAERELAAAEGEASGLGAHLGLAGRQLEAVALLPVPGRERVTLFQVELVRIEQDAGAVAARQAAVEASRDDLQRVLRELGLTGRVPTMDDLHAARARRDRGWELVRRAWLGAPPDAAGSTDAAAYCGELPLPDAYAAAVAAADEVADDLRDAGERVVRAAQARAGLEACEGELALLAERRARLDAGRRALEERWLAEWAPAGLVPAAAEQMQGWLDRHGRLVALARRAEGLRSAIAAAGAALDGHRCAIADALAGLGEPAAAEERLDDLQARATETAAGLAATRQERTRLLAALDDLEAQRAELEVELEAARADMAGWEAGWRAAQAPLRLAAGTTATAAAAALRKLGEAMVRIDESNVLRARREGIRRDMERYEAAVRALVAEVAPDLGGRPAPAAAAELEERLARNRDWDAQRRERLQAREALVVRRERAEAAQRQDRAGLEELMLRLGAGSPEDLERVVERAAEGRSVVESLAQCETELLQQGGGWTVEQYVREAAATSPEQVAAEVTAAEERLAALRREHQEAVRAEAAARTELDRLDGSGAAAEAAAEAEEHRARILAEAGRLLRLRVAQAVLAREIELYRDRNQAPLLRAAGELFAEITLGRFVRLKAETDARDRLVIVGVTAVGDEKSVAQMSSGTRDQLYLALRLATLGQHFEANPPMPVVLDDILINFDDSRARATLHVLARLARRTQVLLFTHHGRVLELARASLPADAFAEHLLPGPDQPGEVAISNSAA